MMNYVAYLSLTLFSFFGVVKVVGLDLFIESRCLESICVMNFFISVLLFLWETICRGTVGVGLMMVRFGTYLKVCLMVFRHLLICQNKKLFY